MRAHAGLSPAIWRAPGAFILSPAALAGAPDVGRSGQRKAQPTRGSPRWRVLRRLPQVLANRRPPRSACGYGCWRHSGVPGGAAVDGRAPVGGVLCDMGRHVQRAQIGDEIGGVVGFVASLNFASAPSVMRWQPSRRSSMVNAASRPQPPNGPGSTTLSAAVRLSTSKPGSCRLLPMLTRPST